MSLLTVRALVRSLGQRRLLAIDELCLSAGESCVLTGANGSGKSTLLRILAGIDAPDAGTGCFDGRPFGWSPYPDWLRKQVTYVHQQPYVFHSSVIDNVAYGLRARGVPRAERARPERARRVEEALSWARLHHLLDSPPARLSGGEKQRLALARAWVLRPRTDRQPRRRLPAADHRAAAHFRRCGDDSDHRLPRPRRH
ncbi:MAG: Energy-coupling factor transporter ATP-binding protein EcfA1 [Candidatus Accumulibacter sp. BA-94]|nr:MAG: Energy-coupling factor transporter ATP-binding protein EcfA1 [Candidatus Accumulibacter sp. BA-94]